MCVCLCVKVCLSMCVPVCVCVCVLVLQDDLGRTSLSLAPHKSGITSVRSSKASLQPQTVDVQGSEWLAKLRTTMATSLFMMPTCSEVMRFLSLPL